MTQLLDRLTNQRINFQNLLGPIEPGRYMLLNDAKINNHPKIQTVGSLLCGDGTGAIRINDHAVACLDQLQDNDETRFELASQSIHQIAGFTHSPDKKLPSPLLPSQLLTDEGDLNELEQLLQGVLSKGHLHEISRRPRMDVRYDEQVQVVSRAKRLAPSSHRHLASHSECWQRRTFTGIQPKRILSLISEDEYNLYENRVFSRLLDRLERFLTKRLREIEELQQTINDAMGLEDSKELNYRLSQALFSIWGETFSADDTLQAAQLLENTQEVLEHQLKTIKGLMHAGIYTRVPRNAQVPIRLEPTNILTHDPHYRHLFPLWNNLTKVSRNFELTPEERLEEQNQLQADYNHYCALLIHRSIRALGYSNSHRQDITTFTKGSHQLTLSNRNSTLLIRDENFVKSISLCPIATWHSGSIEVTTNSEGTVIPCVLFNSQQPEHPSQWLDGSHSGAMQLSPLDFYVEERLVSLINSWMILNNVQAYGEKLTKLPTDVLNCANEITGISVNRSRHIIQLLQPMQQNDVDLLTISLRNSNAQAAGGQFTVLVLALDELSVCPVCQSKARFIPRDNRSFKAECSNNSCKLIWSIEHQAGERYFQLTTGDTGNTSFMESGRWYQKTRLSQDKVSL